MPIVAGDWAGTPEIFLLHFAIDLHLFTGDANPWIHLVSAAPGDVPGAGVLHRLWAGLEDVGPGPDLRRVCSRVALLCIGVPPDGSTPAAADELENSWDLRHVFSGDLCVRRGGEEEEGLLGRRRNRGQEKLISIKCGF